MSRFDSEVILEYSNFAPGDTVSGQLCPSCKGGSSRERSMSVGRTDDWLWWRCHRASCGYKGAHQFGALGPKQSTKQAELSKLTYNTSKLVCVSQLAKTLNLKPESIEFARWQWTKEYDGRVVMPVFAPDGSRRGDNLRSYDTGRSKNLTNRFKDEPFMCWYKQSLYPSTCIVVEDQSSALRCSEVTGWAGVALMGTDLSYAKARELKASGVKNFVLSLDQDATAKAVTTVIQYRSMLQNLRLIALDKDIKNMNAQEFELYICQVREVINRV